MVDPQTPLDVYRALQRRGGRPTSRRCRRSSCSLAGVGKLECGPDVAKPKQAATTCTPEFEAYVSLAGLIDVAAEIKRLEKQLAEKRKHLQGTARPSWRTRVSWPTPPPRWCSSSAIWWRSCEKQITTIEDTLRELRQA